MRIKDKEGNEIKLTPDHRILVKDKGWIDTKDIVKGDIIIKLEPKEHIDYDWLSIKDAKEKVFSWTNRLAIEKLDEIMNCKNKN